MFGGQQRWLWRTQHAERLCDTSKRGANNGGKLVGILPCRGHYCQRLACQHVYLANVACHCFNRHDEPNRHAYNATLLGYTDSPQAKAQPMGCHPVRMYVVKAAAEGELRR